MGGSSEPGSRQRGMQPAAVCVSIAETGSGKPIDMHLREQLAERLGNPLDWHSAHKSIFVLAIVWLLILGYLAWTFVVLVWPFGTAEVRAEHVVPHIPWLVVLLGFTTIFLAGSWFAARKHPESVLHQHLCAQWYAIVLLTLAHFTGLWSLATGVILCGAVVVGFMFLNRLVVFAAMGMAVAIHAVLTVAMVYGVLPDGPMLGPSHGPDGSLNTFWVSSMYIFTAPQLAVLVGLSYYILTRWRQREAEVRLLSMTDPLTGMANRRAIMALLKRELEKGHETGSPVSVVMADLDNFKTLNDARGHPAGDEVLRSAAQALRTELRQSDHVGRYGGEEFLMVLPGADDQGASLLAERCRAGIQGLRISFDDEGPIAVTASFGLCSNHQRRDLSEDDLLRAADDALYLAKQYGRNRIEITHP